jgi:pimeloyl-ACP methyl ester carboxylesterase
MAIVEYVATPMGRVAYRRLGRGPRLLIALHGFGDDGRVFEGLAAPLSTENATLYSIDLPFHGQTRWADRRYSPEALAVAVAAVWAAAGRRPFEAVGHSLGARLWLYMLPSFAENMKTLHLIAPDGMYSPWSWLREGTPLWLRFAVGPLVRNPAFLLVTARRLRRWGFIDRFALRYLERHLSTVNHRRRLLRTWQSLAYFRLGAKRARALLQAHPLPVKVYLGEQDALLPADTVLEAFSGLPQVEVHCQKGGHWAGLR